MSSGGTVPTEFVRKDFSTISVSPAADPTNFILELFDNECAPIEGGTVTLQADNGTVLNGKTDKDGRCSLEVKIRRIFCLLIAHPKFPAAFISRVDPADCTKVTLPKTDNLGSVIIHSTGYIPGLRGRLNPILDSSNRNYLYTDNIAIEGGKTQPVNFTVNQPIELEDVEGRVVYATVKHIAARTALIQFTRR